jgi:hypothetical protein
MKWSLVPFHNNRAFRSNWSVIFVLLNNSIKTSGWYCSSLISSSLSDLLYIINWCRKRKTSEKIMPSPIRPDKSNQATFKSNISTANIIYRTFTGKKLYLKWRIILWWNILWPALWTAARVCFSHEPSGSPAPLPVRSPTFRPAGARHCRPSHKPSMSFCLPEGWSETRFGSRDPPTRQPARSFACPSARQPVHSPALLPACRPPGSTRLTACAVRAAHAERRKLPVSSREKNPVCGEL